MRISRIQNQNTSPCRFLLFILIPLAFFSGCASLPEAPSNKKWTEVCGTRNTQACYDYGVQQIRFQNVEKSMQIFAVTCGRNVGDACNNLGALELRKDNKRRAKKLFQQACDLKSGGGCSNLACILGNGPCVGGEWSVTEEVTRILEQSCKYGFAPGCFNLGQAHAQLGQWKRAEKALEKSCALKEADGCYQLGSLQMELYNDMQVAAPAFERACHLGHNVSCLATNSLFNQSDAGGLYE